MTFCSSGVAPGASSPMLPLIRPHSSKFAEFISSCTLLPSIGMLSWLPERVSNLNLSPPCSAIRAKPSHLAAGLVVALQAPLPTKLLP